MKVSFGQTGIGCNPNTFWAMQGTSIGEYTLINDSTSFVSNVWSGTLIDGNLAYCFNLDGGSFSPTFYSTFNFQQPRYYDGSQWITTSASVAPDRIYNPGAYGNYLYYLLYNPGSANSKGIVRYNGSSFSTIYEWDTASRKATVFDLAVDTNGNVFVFTGPNNSSNTTDSLYLISPDGELIKQYHFAFDTYGTRGLFLLNEVLYLGIDGSNITYPNSLIPVRLTDSTAIAGTPIYQPASADLASCDVNLFFTLQEEIELPNSSVYPNPANEEIILSGLSKGQKINISICDVTGREVKSLALQTENQKLNTEGWLPGIYFVLLRSKNKISTQKIAIQH